MIKSDDLNRQILLVKNGISHWNWVQYELTELYLGLAGAVVKKNFNQAHSEGDCQNER